MLSKILKLFNKMHEAQRMGMDISIMFDYTSTYKQIFETKGTLSRKSMQNMNYFYKKVNEWLDTHGKK